MFYISIYMFYMLIYINMFLFTYIYIYVCHKCAFNIFVLTIHKHIIQKVLNFYFFVWVFLYK